MAWYHYFKKQNKTETKTDLNQEESIKSVKNHSFISSGRVEYNPILEDVYDGEKTPGELGAVYDTLPDHIKLRLRAYDLNLKSDIIKIITGKFFKWVVGSGLKLQAEPKETVLSLYGIKEDFKTMRRDTEALFSLYASSKYSDYHKKDDFHEKASEAFKTAFLGGDCLCVIRVDEFGPNMQVIDGQEVETPFDDKEKEKGNVIKKGIELNKKGQHVAFWVRVDDEDSVISHKRIKAENSNGNLVAWMIYGDKNRIGDHRGIPRISAILEKVSKLDRFVEASVSKAEKTADVVYAFKHNTNSTGINILTENLTSKKSSDSEKSLHELNEEKAHMLRRSTSGTVMNLTPDSDLISLDSQSQTDFKEFFRAIFVTLCAAVDIPEEVALQKYEQNYSSSRAAINGWEFIIEIYRQKFAKNSYQQFYRFWLEYQVLTDQIKLKNFLKAKTDKNFMALEAYFSARFTGKKMPHIDPLKEAKAIRSLLGDNTEALISYEQAAEAMGVGDWSENFKKYLEERKIIPKEDAENKDNIAADKLDSDTKN